MTTTRPDIAALPEGAVLLHIGPYKTGTTAIQSSLQKHRADLAEHGVLYPGSGVRQRRASWAAVGRSPRGMPTVGQDSWQKMLGEIHESDAHRVVVSSEDFTSAPAEAVRTIVDDLGADRVHVVMVIRPLDKLLPSSWQQRVKSARETMTLDEWLRGVLEKRGQWRSRAFWDNQSVEKLVGKYANAVPRERIILVVSDESDRTQQMRLFESLLALPEGLLTPGEETNTSLSLARTELLRRVNLLAAERGWSEEIRRALIHAGMLPDLREAPLEPGEPMIPGLPAWAADRVDRLNRGRAERVRTSGCRVVGDPEALTAPARVAAPVPLPEHVSIAVAAAGVAGVVEAVRRGEVPQSEMANATEHHAPRARLAGISSRALVREVGRRTAFPGRSPRLRSAPAGPRRGRVPEPR